MSDPRETSKVAEPKKVLNLIPPNEKQRVYNIPAPPNYESAPPNLPYRHSKKRSSTPHLNRMRPLDGIRGLSVACVVLFHAGVKGAGGLYMGVDGFFVLSGFLITSLLISDVRENGSVSFSSFWARRARRLFPALVVLIAVVIAVEAIYGDRAQLDSIRGDALAAMFYCSNWYYIFTHVGYFGASQAVSPLQHTWSLAIEEQFYIIWPFVVYLVAKKLRSLWPLFYLSIIGALLSAIDMAISYGNGAGLNHAYYGTDTRAQALLIGCALAVATSFAIVVANKTIRKLAPYVAFVAFILIVGLWSRAAGPPAWMFRGGFLLSDICVGFLILAVRLSPQNLFVRSFAIKPLTFLGDISYGLYLWQFPVVILFNETRTGFSGISLFVLRAFVSILIATVSYYVIEQPIRRGYLFRNGAAWVAVFLAASALIIGSIFLGTIPNGQSVSLHANLSSQNYQTKPLKVMIAGDSIAETLAYYLAGPSKSAGFEIQDDGTIGCGIFQSGEDRANQQVGYQGGNPTYCAHTLDNYVRDIKTFNPDVIVFLAGRWEILDRNWGSGWEHIGEQDFDNRLEADMKTYFRALAASGAPVCVLTMPYIYVYDVSVGGTLVDGSPSRVDEYNSLLRQVISQLDLSNVKVLDFNAVMDPNGTYTQTINGATVRTDDGIHLTSAGALYAGNWLLPQVRNLGNAWRQKQINDKHG